MAHLYRHLHDGAKPAFRAIRQFQLTAMGPRNVERDGEAQPGARLVEVSRIVEAHEGAEGLGDVFRRRIQPRQTARLIEMGAHVARRVQHHPARAVGRRQEDPQAQIARRIGGRVVAPDLDGLGAAVIGDYLRSRRAR